MLDRKINDHHYFHINGGNIDILTRALYKRKQVVAFTQLRCRNSQTEKIGGMEGLGDQDQDKGGKLCCYIICLI